MKLLLDENLPKKLKIDLAEHEIYTISDKKWNSKQKRRATAIDVRRRIRRIVHF